MLSYRHVFHAGNLGDVLKHLALLATLRAATRKETPLAYLESHAGAGSYALADDGPAEYRTGIAPLWRARRDVSDPLLRDYLQLVLRAQTRGTPAPGDALPDLASEVPLRRYPGSPWFARATLRPPDDLWLAELHPTDYTRLVDLFRDRAYVHVERMDGHALLRAQLPPKARRGVVLIDPAYELADEADRVLASLADALRRFGHGTYLVWAPLRGKAAPSQMERVILRLAPSKLLRVAFTPLDAPAAEHPPLGSVLWLLNPPYLVDEALRAAFAECAPLLAVQAEVRWLLGG
jgi:23S rRNA (adenine2030-N6)-methyltransferase